MNTQIKKRTMPLWLGVLCIILGVSGIMSAAFGAITNYQVALPIVGDIQFADAELEITSLSLIYNSTSLLYEEIELDVHNTGTISHSGKFQIDIYTVANILIASGVSSEVTIPAGGTMPMDTLLIWIITYTVSDCVYATWQLQQTG